MIDHGSPRQGVAMATVLAAVVVIGIVIAGVFFGSSQEVPIGRSHIFDARALSAVEHAIARALTTWGSEAVGLPVGGSTESTATTQEGDTITSTITRTGNASFWLVAEAVAGPNSESRRRVGVMLQPAIPHLGPPAALTVQAAGGIRLNELLAGSVVIDGADSQPSAWAQCPRAGADAAGISTDSTQGDLASNHCGSGPCVSGSPSVLTSSAVGDSIPFGQDQWDLLTARATIRLAAASVIGGVDRPLGPRVEDGRCDTSIDHNWGDPSRHSPCGSYFPVIHVTGDLHLLGGAGQGTLLVDGDLHLSGGVEFVGAVFVRGAFITGPGGARIRGITHVGGRSARASMLTDGAELIFSRCAATSALAAVAPPRILPRSWIELH